MRTTSPQQALERRAFRALLGHAVFRLESTLTIALTMVLIFLYPTPFAWWRWWFWLILGVAGEALIIITSLTDSATARQVAADMLRQTHDPTEVRTPALRSVVERALDYQERVAQAVTRAPSGTLRAHLQDTTAGIEDWITGLFRLVKRLDEYERDDLLRGETAVLQTALQQLRIRLDQETAPGVRAEIQQALRGRELQRENLQRLEQTMERARYQIDVTLSALATVYAQLLLVSAQDMDSARSQRIGESIREQVASLNDLLGAMNELHAARAEAHEQPSPV
ncbi:MAG: hypothetical protein ACUVX9_14520 [Anaerolineae bacterium]